MNTARKRVLLGVFIGTLGLSGLAQFVYANQPQPVAVVPQKHRAQATETSDGDGETNDDIKEQQEAVKLQPLAKITAQQAQQVAEAAQKTKASKVKLENEEGSLVYTVIVGQQEVTVDAGNARILYTEPLRQENHTSDVSHPRSSIQVSQASDGDGETNDDG
ncbi:PepSY domain-containing protein [Stenomitos frigidus]|uniref:Peptidase n=1 Tax=Stenomitos frigidus ULC18 TaxID=2107698 RepID=A0A2T1E0V9_9CYAN|nr:PepSY domain-containing protein [Stenomitos frigidus]PSB26395.1 peptidase [Stenomitos frigidus ULC18]